MNILQSPSVSDVTNITNTVSSLLSENPVMGLTAILVSLGVVYAVTLLAIWGAVRIIRAKKAPSEFSFDKVRYMENISSVIGELARFNAEREELTRSNVIIREHSVMRDQMLLAEATLDSIKAQLLVEVSHKLSRDTPEYNGKITDLPAYRVFVNTIDYVVDISSKYLRRCARENHFVEKNDREFEQYLSNKTEHLKLIIQRNFDISSPHSPYTTPWVQEHFNEMWGKLKVYEKFRELFLEMKHIATQYNRVITEKETEFTDRWQTFLSNIPDRIIEGAVSNPQGGH